ncbi:MAG: tetratricopeptide repeat protein, partial [Bacteroidota bacterium]
MGIHSFRGCLLIYWFVMLIRLLTLLALVCLLSITCVYAQTPSDTIPPLVDSLIMVSRTHTNDAEFDQAAAVSQLAGTEALACCGENSAAYAAYCFNEGRIRDFRGRTKESISWYIKSRELRGVILGKNHLEYGKSCNNLAIVYDELNRYEEAEPLYLEVLQIREAAAGRRSAVCAAVLANLGGMYSSMGDNDIAEQMILEALDIRKQVLGEHDPLYAQNLMLLAGHYHDLNNYQDAEPLLLEAKRIYDMQEQSYFYDDLKVLEYLGQLYLSIYDYEKSQYYMEQAVALIKEAYGEENRLYANSLNYLATVAMETHQVQKREAYLQEELISKEH